VVGLPAKREMAITVMGQQIALPVIISSAGVQAVHPGGEVAVARAAAVWPMSGGTGLHLVQIVGETKAPPRWAGPGGPP
jgi:isopentenyl diphosphate isomerase/L-lactate dehydrogenase-like FMN-dependent dehydrogenase